MTEEFVRLDVVRFALKDEAWMVTVSTRWEPFSFDAGDLVFLRVSRIVSYSVNARNRNRVTRLEYLANLRHNRHPLSNPTFAVACILSEIPSRFFREAFRE